MLNRRVVLAGASTLALMPLSAFAHRLARSETEVLIDEDGRVEVAHAYHIQDAQDALFEAKLIDKPDLGSLRARARLALYTSERFGLKAGEEWTDLEIVDAEIKGSRVYVYQRGMIGSGTLSVKAEMLRDLMSDQINSVNIVRGGETITVEFKGQDGVKSV